MGAGLLIQTFAAIRAARVIVVCESIVSRYFAGNAIGKRVIIPELKFNIEGREDIPAEIVGIVGNVCVNSVEDCRAEHIYLPEKQNAFRMEHLLVRTEGEPMAAAKAVRHAVYLEAPSLPLDDPQSFEQRTAYRSDGPKRAMWLLGVFAGLALLLAAVVGWVNLVGDIRSRGHGSGRTRGMDRSCQGASPGIRY